MTALKVFGNVVLAVMVAVFVLVALHNLGLVGDKVEAFKP